MITIEAWLRQNNVPGEGIEEFRIRKEYRKFILAQSTTKEEAEVATLDRKTNSMVFMKRVTDISLQVDPALTKIFLIGIDSWERMTKSNIWNQHLPQNQGDDNES